MTDDDHDLLIRIDERTERLETHFENHLNHHRAYTYLAWSTAIGMIVALIIMLVR